MPDEQPSSTAVHAWRRTAGQGGRRFSEVLREIADDTSRERVSVGDMFVAMGDRAFGALMLLFALPNVLPTPPGTSSILGVPLVILAAQLTLGQNPWLPKIVTDRSMPRSDFAKLIERVSPWLAKAEKRLKPRLGVLVRPPAEYVVGALCLTMAIILALPMPLGNIPPALAICLFSFGILERDGIWVIAGMATFAVSIAIVSGILFALLKGAIFILTNAFN
ncbi:exopolysaccharide biosynthesis protein [Sinorhizobium medicae]|uniref:ABC transporter permease n=1 Tax=Sinorhizobium medicae TaxID=110321 RepID=A0ABX4THM9_9HYPH|nr:exopolysaccharide biosynthesis protein [Sinorhizobium medicae]PLT99055.1 ABC transporter permease [Sinorhizobium medicae]PLU16677.1 ABC transporter permease [Sinorhizobium medicae]PLU77229.1 ABC transporter permease [Sinorhizobium medicae]